MRWSVHPIGYKLLNCMAGQIFWMHFPAPETFRPIPVYFLPERYGHCMQRLAATHPGQVVNAYPVYPLVSRLIALASCRCKHLKKIACTDFWLAFAGGQRIYIGWLGLLVSVQ